MKVEITGIVYNKALHESVGLFIKDIYQHNIDAEIERYKNEYAGSACSLTLSIKGEVIAVINK